MNDFNFNDMYVFTKVAECKSITSASRKLGASKQTVSRQIIRLEQSLGISLIRRTTRNFELTSAGLEYYKSCENIIKGAESANCKMRSYQESPVGVVRVSLPGAFNCSALSNLFKAFLRSNPDIRIDVQMTNKRICLVNDNVDLAFRIGTLEDSTLIARQLGEIEFGYMAGAEYFRNVNIPESIDDFSKQTVIFIKGCKLIDGLGESKGTGQRIQVNEFSMAKQFAIDGIGIAMLPTFCCTEELKSGKLTALDNPEFMTQRDLSLVFLRSKYMPNYVRKLIDFVVDYRDDELPWQFKTEQIANCRIPRFKNLEIA